MSDRFRSKTKREIDREGQILSDRKNNRGSKDEYKTETERASEDRKIYKAVKENRERLREGNRGRNKKRK